MAVDVLGSTLDPLIAVIQPFILKLSFIFGGIFGLYVLLIIIRVYYERKKVKLMEAMRYNSDIWNEHHGVPNSRSRRGVFRRFGGYVKTQVLGNGKTQVVAANPKTEIQDPSKHKKTKNKSSKK